MGGRRQHASLAAALVDRSLHHGEVFYLRGPSFDSKVGHWESELVTAAPALTNGTDGGLEAEQRTGGSEDAVR
jgi:hypothetical protein